MSLMLSAWGVKNSHKLFPSLEALSNGPQKALKKPGGAMTETDARSNNLLAKLRAQNPDFLSFLGNDEDGDSD